MSLSLCIVGCGRYARTVAQAIHGMTEDLELLFASRELEAAREYCDTYGGGGFFGSYEEASADPRVEAMYFFTPHDLHLENVRLAARRFKHVIVEKPIARTIAEATEMIRVAKDAGVKLMVAENYRFLPSVVKCKQLMSLGLIGDLRLIQIRKEGYSEPPGWRRSATRTGGGVFIDGGIHAVDMLVNLGTFPDRVYAANPRQIFSEIEGEDGLVLVCHLPGGGGGLINYSAGTCISEPRHWVSVTGTKGEISFEPHGSELTLETADTQRIHSLPDPSRGIRDMVRELGESIAENREPTMSGWEGLKDLAVVTGAYDSVSQGTEVSLILP